MLQRVGFSLEIVESLQKGFVDGKTLMTLDDHLLSTFYRISDFGDRKRLLSLVDRLLQHGTDWLIDSLVSRLDQHQETSGDVICNLSDVQRIESILKENEERFGDLVNWTEEQVTTWFRSFRPSSSSSNQDDSVSSSRLSGFVLCHASPSELRSLVDQRALVK